MYNEKMCFLFKAFNFCGNSLFINNDLNIVDDCMYETGRYVYYKGFIYILYASKKCTLSILACYKFNFR